LASKKERKSGLLSIDATIAENRRAHFDYHIEETFEAGIALLGTEVKSLRLGQCSIAEAYIGPKGNDIALFNCYIGEYQQAGHHLQHEPRRIRTLLLHRKQINKLVGSVTREGYTIAPIKMYFDGKGRAKLLIGLAKGKKNYDKREDIKKRDWGREKQRLMKEKG